MLTSPAPRKEPDPSTSQATSAAPVPAGTDELPHPWVAQIVVSGLWALVVVAAGWVDPPAVLVELALVLHVIGLVLALGPVVLVDWYALVWVAGLDRPLTWVKMFLVLVIVNNGVAVRLVAQRLRRLGNPTTLAEIPTRIRRIMLTVAVTSQVSWWTAALIGFVTSAGRHRVGPRAGLQPAVSP